jgi:hypothetical protein
MKQGFELLRIRSIDDTLEIKSYEKNGLLLPPIYKVFVQSFEPDFAVNTERFLHPQWGDVVDLTIIQYLPLPELIMVYELFTLEKSFDVLQSVYQNNEEVMRLKLLPIGECALNGMLMLGTDQNNQDQIFFEQPHGEQRITLIADNIFKFMRGIRQLPDEKGNIGRYTYSQLYKNWGEDFWRVRD